MLLFKHINHICTYVPHIPQGDIQRIWKGIEAVMYKRLFAERILNWLIFT
jgi:hypothetical protein